RSVMRVIHMLTEPVLEPLRRLIPPAGGLDFSPLIAFLIIRAIQMALTA
ncbi:MAG: YggT family protein, partial [Chloroflexi bacterium]|nr:YggT family protein [Chloroflexota bacterium]